MGEYTDTSALGSRRPLQSGFPLYWVVGLLGLALRASGELTRVVGQMHRAWEDLPPPLAWPPLGKKRPFDPAAMPGVYRLIHSIFDGSANQLQRLALQAPAAVPQPLPLKRIRCAMNGVFGDKLEAWQLPLAQPLTLVDAQGEPLQLDEVQAQGKKGVVLFLHGLCLSEYEWQTSEGHHFVQDLQAQGYSTAWVRYNTGLPIWENGSLLNRYLATHWQQKAAKPLSLIGHSMGGLVIRSALHHGEQVEPAHWIDSLQQAAYLASPHAGARFERIGNRANSLLGVSPYTRPLMALGNIRSRGIRSLRHGSLVPPTGTGNEQAVQFNPRIRHLLLAARLGDDPASRWLGDGLVPLASALGKPVFPAQHAQVERVVLEEVGHLQLLNDARTYEALRHWMGLTTAS